ncbi:MAG: dihydroxyacetone kinase subunit L [Planctomycetota bacterium]|jgi:dihydroxyacetone kinase-like protein|nr:dihydroxyacetone kinase subunit L [Planctomycetota bacterium]
MTDGTLDAAGVRRILEAMADKIIASRDYLNDIDSGIGDADHGTGMAQSFAKARERMAAVGGADAAGLIKGFASGVLAGGGGASGALFGSLFGEGAKAMAGKAAIAPSDLAAWWRAGLTLVQARGKAKPGDKTMVDALEPAARALEENAAAGFAIQMEKAVQAARDGVEATKSMVAGQGRSRYAGERSLGRQDAGATSVALLLEAMSEALSRS